MEKRVEAERKKRQIMQNEVKLAKGSETSSGANSHVSHHKEGAAWVPSTSATPVVGEPGVVSSRKERRWQRGAAEATNAAERPKPH